MSNKISQADACFFIFLKRLTTNSVIKSIALTLLLVSSASFGGLLQWRVFITTNHDAKVDYTFDINEQGEINWHQVPGEIIEPILEMYTRNSILTLAENARSSSTPETVNLMYCQSPEASSSASSASPTGSCLSASMYPCLNQNPRPNIFCFDDLSQVVPIISREDSTSNPSLPTSDSPLLRCTAAESTNLENSMDINYQPDPTINEAEATVTQAQLTFPLPEPIIDATARTDITLSDGLSFQIYFTPIVNGEKVNDSASCEIYAPQ